MMEKNELTNAQKETQIVEFLADLMEANITRYGVAKWVIVNVLRKLSVSDRAELLGDIVITEMKRQD